MSTLLLDRTYWDLVLDSAGNIAMATAPYALAQDVASAVKLFLGELYYNTFKGVPYFSQVLGKLPPASVLLQLIEAAALSVPGVVTATVVIQSFNSRQVTGQIQFTDESGVTTAVGF